MYDNSTKQIQDVEVGDVVKSYQPVGMSLSDMNFKNFSMSTLSGSFSGSVVVGKQSQVGESYYLINGSMKVLADDTNGAVFTSGSDGTWSWKYPYQLQQDDKLLDVTGSQQNINSISLVQSQETFYSLDVEDIDTYFSSDILVHNIPTKFCFTYDTMVTLSDGTYEKICKIKPNDMIKTYNDETGKLQNSKVLETVKVLHDNIVKYKVNNNTIIEATDNHPLYVVDKGYKAPLEIGDVVFNDELNKLEVVKIEVDNKQQITYNINRTDSGKNYFANKVLVSDESDT